MLIPVLTIAEAVGKYAVHVGAVIGMGIGFIAMAAVWAYYREK